jgi:hypothetical protein
MFVIVPLAGPDCYSSLGIRPLTPVGDSTLVKTVLASRWKQVQYVFILREHEALPTLKRYLQHTFEGCRIIVMSHLTKGAAITALTGISLTELDQPVAIDLADITYEGHPNVEQAFAADAQLAGLIPYFESSEPQYSYLKLGTEEEVLDVAEKDVISTHATAGVYAFRDAALYLRAVSYALDHQETHKGLYFACPLYKGLIRQQYRIRGFPVDIAGQYSLSFHD